MMKVILFFAVVALASARRTFHGVQVFRMHPKSNSDVQLIREFGSLSHEVDFWKPDSADQIRIGQTVDVAIPGIFVRAVKDRLDYSLMSYTIMIKNLQELVDNERNSSPKPKLDGYDYDNYHTYKEIIQWANDITEENPDIAYRFTLGYSYEGREIPLLAIGASFLNPFFFIDCGIHAREWISPAFCQCFSNRMISGYGSDPDITAQLDAVTFVIIPVLNVDGYSYSHTDDRMWRKTRSNYGTVCDGVDPNRNFDANWSGPGSSSSPCSETYYGPSVASEPMSAYLSNLVISLQPKAYVTFHSYGQVIIFPYSCIEEYTHNYEELNELASNSAHAVRNVHGKIYTFGSGHEVFYVAAGGSDDFSFDQGTQISFTIELRDTGRYGFILPANQIREVCEEMAAGVDVITKHIM